MPHQDQGRSVEVNSSALKRRLETVLAPADFSQIRFRRGLLWRSWGGLLFRVWSEAKTLGDRWLDARRLVGTVFGLPGLPGTYQPFMRLLVRHSDSLRNLVIGRFRRHIREGLESLYRVEGFVAFAVDGTRHQTPRQGGADSITTALHFASGWHWLFASAKDQYLFPFRSPPPCLVLAMARNKFAK